MKTTRSKVVMVGSLTCTTLLLLGGLVGLASEPDRGAPLQCAPETLCAPAKEDEGWGRAVSLGLIAAACSFGVLSAYLVAARRKRAQQPSPPDLASAYVEVQERFAEVMPPQAVLWGPRCANQDSV